MKPIKNNRPVVVGIFIFLGLVIFAIAIFTLGGQKKTFVKTFTINAIFNDRLVVEHYIFQYANELHSIKANAIKTQLNDTQKIASGESSIVNLQQKVFQDIGKVMPSKAVAEKSGQSTLLLYHPKNSGRHSLLDINPQTNKTIQVETVNIEDFLNSLDPRAEVAPWQPTQEYVDLWKGQNLE